MIQTNLKEWGNSKAIRIPKTIISKLGLENLKDPITFDINVEKGTIVLTPINKLTKLDILFEGYDNLDIADSDFDWDEPVGQEIF